MVKAGQIVKVKVVEVDLKRRRVALTMKLQEPVLAGRPDGQPVRGREDQRAGNPRPSGPRPLARPVQPSRPQAPATSMAAAFSKLKG